MTTEDVSWSHGPSILEHYSNRNSLCVKWGDLTAFCFVTEKKPTNTSTVYMRLISLHDQVLLVKRVQIDLNYMSFIHLQTRWVLIILQLWIYSMKKHFGSWPFSQPSIMLTQRLGEVIFVCNVNVRFWQLSRDDGLILYRLNGFVLSSTHNILCVSETSSGILYILVEEGVGRGASEPWTKADSAGDKSLLLLKGSFFFLMEEFWTLLLQRFIYQTWFHPGPGDI